MAKLLSTKEKLNIINRDPVKWLNNFVKIVNNDGNLVNFKVNGEQNDFITNMGKYNIILKARQIGFTTLSLGLMLYYASNMPMTSYIILSYDTPSVNNIFEKLKNMYNSIPSKYRVKDKRCNRNELVLENGSRIIVKTVGTKELGRSYTFQLIHCSEFAFWNKEQQVKGLLGLEQALAKNESSKIIIESTANGLDNNYYNLFNSAIRGNSKYKAFFYNWFSNKVQFAYEYKQAEQWYKELCSGRRLSEKDLTKYELDLYNNGASLLQLMWRQWKLQDIEEEKFNQEYPSTPQDAFISTDKGVFDGKVITDRYNELPNSISYNELKDMPSIVLPYINNGLNIYQHVKANEKYYCGIDTASGLGGNRDNSCMVILDSDGEQVAHFSRNDIPIYRLARIVYELGMYFNYAMLLIEINRDGANLIDRLRREKGYINILRTKKFTAKGKSYVYGFDTTQTSKAKIIDQLKECFEEGLILINDRETLDQMRIYQECNGKLGNRNGSNNHDDSVMALALSVECWKQNKYYV